MDKKNNKIFPLVLVLAIILNPVLILITILVVANIYDYNNVITYEGIDVYYQKPFFGNFELTQLWIPQENKFWDKFEYEEADFWFEIKHIFNESGILYVKYDEKLMPKQKNSF